MAGNVFQMFLVIILVALAGTNGVRSEVCSSAEFYCPYDSSHHCKPKSARCLLESERNQQSCLNPQTHQEEGCRGDLTTGIFEIWDGWTPFQFKSSSTYNSGYRFKHEFVTYRGFTYEYNIDGVYIIDINDPNYIYNTRKVSEYKKVGTSRCKASDFSSFISEWEEEGFVLIGHNCQDFARHFIKFLKSDCRATQLLMSADTKFANTSDKKMQRFDDNDEMGDDRAPTFGSNFIRPKVNAEEDGFVNSAETEKLLGNTDASEHTGTYSNFTVGFVVLGVVAAVLTVGFLVAIVIAKKKKKHTEEKESLLRDI